MDFALRTIESIAFSLHSILGITEPCTGCLRSAFQDNGAMPAWFWPLAGIALAVVAAANFSGNDTVILVAQAYVVAFHIGGVLYHRRLGHHPAAGCGPGFFVPLAIAIAATRVDNFLYVLLGTAGCAAAALVLSRVLVTPPQGREEAMTLLEQRTS